MKRCSVESCQNNSFGKDKLALKPYCKRHQYLRTDKKKKVVVVEKITEKSFSELIKTADSVFSLYIRKKYANKNGLVKCYTCNKELHYSEIENGHFISRGHYAARFLEDNCRPQCSKCNSIHNDKPEIFKEKLEQENIGIIDKLLDLKKKISTLTRSDLIEIINKYNAKQTTEL